jgi:hypothetical protein
VSYPQPFASQEVIEGQEFFRINTLLESSGDLYEIDTSAKAFVIGPESDIARARVTYYDPSVPSRSSSFVVSVGDPFFGRIDALASQSYPVAGTPARIIVSLEDLYEPRWVPSLAAVGVVRVRPKLDLLAYLSTPSNLPTKRADFTTRGRLTIAVGETGTFILCPYYGRKYASVIITNFTGAGGYAASIDGVNFTTDATSPFFGALNHVQETPIPLPAAGAIPAPFGGTASFEVKASLHGLFDYLVVGISGPPVDGAPPAVIPFPSVPVSTLTYLIRFTDDPI